MSVTLEIEGTAQAPRRAVVRAGELAVVGRSPWADISLPLEVGLDDEHFRLDCRGTTCRLAAENAAVLRNGVKIEGAILEDGDSLTAGGVRFRVRITGLSRSGGEVATAPAETVDRPDEFASVLERAGLSDDGAALVVEDDRLATLDALLEAGLRKDVCRFAVACLPKPEAVRWALEQFAGTTGIDAEAAAQLVAYVAAERDAPAPEELDRRIKDGDARSPGTWLWKAARWSGGSLTKSGLPVVAPAPHLFAVAVGVAVSLASARRERGAFAEWIAAARERVAALEASSSEETPQEASSAVGATTVEG